ncbi:MAG: hypothetical protein LBQ47_03390 [Endomicrobium sp.]|jgi:hypothetical protein|nr:hypothetical protein [Endomicrobium sp.]
MRKFTAILLFVLISPLSLEASSSLLFLEVQAIAGYSSVEDKIIYHSGRRQDPMQKNSLGFDLIKKFSSSNSDFLTAALQLRTAFDDNENRAQLQIYNAYLKLKTSFADVWVGHNRISYGLESYWDTHADLLQPLSMFGFGYDRDWGAGISKDTKNGNIQFSLTSATGMALKFDGNYLITSRISKGVLSYDNYNIGLSVMSGNVFDSMGWEIMGNLPHEVLLFGADFAYNRNNVEHKAQITAGKKMDEDAYAGLYRLSFNFLEENKLKLEGQGVYTQLGDIKNYYLSAQAAYKINADLTSRITYARDIESKENKIVMQLYYYFLI